MVGPVICDDGHEGMVAFITKRDEHPKPNYPPVFLEKKRTQGEVKK